MLARNLVGAVEPGRLVFAAAPAADRGAAAGIALGRGGRTAGRAVCGTRWRLRRAVPRYRRLGRGRLAGRRALIHRRGGIDIDRKSTRLNSSHGYISYAVFCLKKK